MTDPKYFEKSGPDPQPPSVMPSSDLAPPGNRPEDPTAMSMVGHLGELRDRILISVAAIVIGLVIGFWQALPVISLFERMAPHAVQFVQIGPGEVFMTTMRVAFYMGLALALPVILYQTLRFVLPGLEEKEKTLVLWSVMGGSVLFVGGVIFAYYCVVPLTLAFFMDFGQSVAVSQISVERYVGFCAALLLMSGAMFELPMILFLLSFTGLITSQKLIAQWRWATVIIFAAAAVITPSQDPFTMMVVGVAMVALYFASILPIRLIGR